MAGIFHYRQGRLGLGHELRSVVTGEVGGLPPVDDTATGFIEQAGRGQAVPFVPVCADGGRQQVPEVIVVPMHPGQAVIDFEPTGLEATGRPGAGRAGLGSSKLRLNEFPNQAGPPVGILPPQGLAGDARVIADFIMDASLIRVLTACIVWVIEAKRGDVGRAGCSSTPVTSRDF